MIIINALEVILFEFGRHSVVLLDMTSILLVVVVTLPIALGAEEFTITANTTIYGILVAYITPGKLLGGLFICIGRAHTQLSVQRIICCRQTRLRNVLNKRGRMHGVRETVYKKQGRRYLLHDGLQHSFIVLVLVVARSISFR